MCPNLTYHDGVTPSGATVHIYKASEDRKDIVESFKATMLPPSMNKEEEGLQPIGFGVTLGDLFGGSDPEDHNSKYEIKFSLEELAEFVNTSIPQTVRYKANSRAVKLLCEVGEWEGRETYVQGKSMRLNQEPVCRRRCARPACSEHKTAALFIFPGFLSYSFLLS